MKEPMYHGILRQLVLSPF